MAAVLPHSLANRHSCLTPTKIYGIDIDSAGPVAEGVINQQTIYLFTIVWSAKIEILSDIVNIYQVITVVVG